jgi:hypothetical protein
MSRFYRFSTGSIDRCWPLGLFDHGSRPDLSPVLEDNLLVQVQDWVRAGMWQPVDHGLVGEVKGKVDIWRSNQLLQYRVLNPGSWTPDILRRLSVQLNILVEMCSIPVFRHSYEG